ncbi:hypothetical protein AGABI2DRAFT_176277 [Agaricus bisporus var. bisporus H97]|uniref:hypothetical protein n=1 Tax=Agaricus bisporus var. bisporus (strain H97 / ATCC MYA-4626 / FGSC 10389) TaxID=936046 RepID=UPI00029F796B|nr:hypothetical protein AGABI2DRAFT_176277 [Agaricus bisporus var. bisporus H97]EKV51896.1 hypothetical protein AGABI2DRAFT_176277 [Agaricus bisporus var. bisporus H97]
MPQSMPVSPHTAFYGTARLGELTVKSLKAFNPEQHIKISDVQDVINRNGLKSKVFHIPVTKVAKKGEDIYWSKQNGDSDPEATFNNHIIVNSPSPNQHLFAYQHGSSTRPLTKIFLHKLSQAAKQAGLEPKKGHAIRIGLTLEYLLRGVPLEAMKHKGRWASEAFSRYLTKHAQIIAPYMQAIPENQPPPNVEIPRLMCRTMVDWTLPVNTYVHHVLQQSQSGRVVMRARRVPLT